MSRRCPSRQARVRPVFPDSLKRLQRTVQEDVEPGAEMKHGCVDFAEFRCDIGVPPVGSVFGVVQVFEVPVDQSFQGRERLQWKVPLPVFVFIQCSCEARRRGFQPPVARFRGSVAPAASASPISGRVANRRRNGTKKPL